MGFLKPKAAKQTSESSNQAYGYLKDQYGGEGGAVDQGNSAMNFISSLLTGAGDVGGANTAWSNYKDQAGYAPALRDMQRGVTATGAASGLLRSGAAGTAYEKKGAELNSGMFGNFLQQLSGLAGLGQNAGQLISGAGSTSSGTSTGAGPSTAGTIAGLAGKAFSIFSDRRTKRDIHEVSVLEDGLGVYTFRYLDDDETRIGVMADEVEVLRPWALGPVVGGFQTVNYGAL